MKRDGEEDIQGPRERREREASEGPTKDAHGRTGPRSKKRGNEQKRCGKRKRGRAFFFCSLSRAHSSLSVVSDLWLLRIFV
jgi:hypothetical protein